MEKYEDDEIEIDLRELFFELRKRIWLIIAAVVVSAGVVGAYSKLILVPQYTSTAMMYILTKETTLASLADLQIGSQLTRDYTVILTSRPVLNKALDDLAVDPEVMDYKDLRKKVTLDNPNDTRIMNITVKDPSPIDAKSYADAIAKAASSYIAEIMEMTPPKIIEEGEIAELPVSPNSTKNAAIGGLLGGFVVCGIIVLMSILNDTVRDEDDVERYLGLTVLAAVPTHSSELGDESSKKKSFFGSFGSKASKNKKHKHHSRKEDN